MEDQLEKEARFRQLMAHNSHDSAIDTDSLEWETEVVEFEKDRVCKPRHVLKCKPAVCLETSWDLKCELVMKFLRGRDDGLTVELSGGHGSESARF